MQVNLEKSYRQLLVIFAYLDEHQGDDLFDLKAFDKEIKLNDTTSPLANAWYHIRKALSSSVIMGNQLINLKPEINFKNYKFTFEQLVTQNQNLETMLHYPILYQKDTLMPCTNRDLNALVTYQIAMQH